MADPPSLRADIAFESLGEMAELPSNYLPAALRALRGENPPADLTLAVLGEGDDPTRFDVATADELAEPARLAERLIPVRTRPRLLGLPLLRGRERARGQAPRFPPADPSGDLGERAVLVVIDHGIAFWNPAFRDGAGPMFEAVHVLDLDATGGIVAGRLDKAEIVRLCGLADGPHGQARVRAELGERFPGSFFGGFLDGHGLWHGTAMTDLALVAAAKGGARPLLFGVELPTALVEDRGGDMLTAFLPTAIDAAVGMTSALADRRLVILLAFGFTGGPQDDRHPAVRAIAQALGRAGGREVTLIVPAGNQRQDRCAARLGPGAGGLPDVASVGWRLPHDDFSANTVEVVAAADPAPVLRLRAPDGAETPVTLTPHLVATLRRGGAAIGALHVRALEKGDLVARLALAPTARRAGGLPAPAGLWRVGIEAPGGAPVSARAWILRDDPMASDRAAPHRLSSFEDGLWRDRDGTGDWQLVDPPGAVVRREGSASVLASAAPAVAAAATERRSEPAAGRAGFRDAAYSGLPLAGRPGPDAREPVEMPAWGGAVEARGNGGRARFRVSGTSAAAALTAGRAAS